MIHIIDIIVPLYNVKQEFLRRCLASILMQTIVPNVIVVDDCSAVDYSQIIDSFGKLMPLKYIKLEKNMGVGHARKVGTQNCNSQYLMFIDSDDLFYTSFSVEKLYKAINKDNSIDFVTGSFIQETDKGELMKCDENSSWVFARIYRRSFLEANEITFSDERLNEDVGFIQLCRACSKKNTIIKDAIVLWKYNTNSLTRSATGNYKKDGTFSFARNLINVEKEKQKRGIEKNKVSRTQICDGLSVLYWYLVKFTYKETVERCEDFMKMIQEYYNTIGLPLEWYQDNQMFTERFFLSSKSMDSVAIECVPKFSIYEMLKDLEDNKDESANPAEFGYEFGVNK